MKWCNNKECEGYEELEDNHCSQAATIERCLEVMSLTTQTDPGAEVPCSDRVINALSDKDKAKMFIDLMCIIHRDGGHYMAEHGEQKAYDDAIKKILALIQEHL